VAKGKRPGALLHSRGNMDKDKDKDKDKNKNKDPARSATKHRQEYTPDFKREAVNLLETGGKSVPQVARDL
jgi:transposase-like protein